MFRIISRALIGASILLIHTQASACDLCSIYNAVDAKKPTANSFKLGVAEQFTSFGKIQENGHYVENKGHQHMESSITQLFGSYDLNEKVGFQLSLPYINRRFKRIERGESDTGTEAGIGDLSLLSKYIPYEFREDENIFFVQIFGGIKLATGSSDRIAEEIEEDHHHVAAEEEHAEHMHSSVLTKHAGEDHEEEMIASAIHGHDLALGSGSYDFPIGMNIFAENGRLFGASGLQYTFRTTGSYDYEYADDLLWDVGPGYYLSLCHDYTIALKANLSGEYKRKDKFDGISSDGTAMRSTFLGPEIILTRGDWNAELAWDIPLDINNSELQAVTDYKLRAALSYKF